MIKAALVLKSGGTYTVDYVSKLANSIERNSTIPIKIVCLSDIEFSLPGIERVTLKHGYPGWWSKIELFRPDLKLERTVYFDLDTIILGNIDILLNLATKERLYVLRGFNQRPLLPAYRHNFATGIMVGNFSAHPSVYRSFVANSSFYMGIERKDWRQGDQGFIAPIVGMEEPSIQSMLPENYIVGRKITKNGKRIPNQARILAWSGEPRIDQLASDHPVTRLWEVN